MRTGLKSIIPVILLVVFAGRVQAGSHLAQGNISGYVFNYYGLAVSGAVVGVENGPAAISAADGYYFLAGVSLGEQNVGCGKTGYNISWILVNVTPGDTVFQDFYLTQPAMVINPLMINEVLNPGEYVTTPLSVLNNGTGPLQWQAAINYFTFPLLPCQYSIALFDTWGDGWSGCSLDVLVNDTVVLDNITLTAGSGPVYFYFDVFSGDQITTDFNPGPFYTEPYYYIYDGDGGQVWFSPAGSQGPPDITPGQLNAGCIGGQWLTMNSYEGDVLPFGGVNNIPVNLDATGMVSGDVYEAEIVVASTPDVGQITVPVVLNVQGDEILPPENLNAELIDPVTGKVKLTWTWGGRDFQFFVVRREGVIIATTTGLTYADILPEHGTYCYTVQAFYNEGISSPSGPECVEWPDPVLSVDPVSLEGWVWPGFTVDVFTTVANHGNGTLYYTFPEYAALQHLREGNIQDPLGAGGPDNFGYVWIDSDEQGGPVFSYTDISFTGTPVFGLADDNLVGPFDIGFNFYFYGEVKTRFWISANGCIGFSSNNITNQNTSIPTNHSLYNDFIAWMWDDLVFRTGVSQVFYQSFPDRMIIQFKNYEHFGQPDLPVNAEVILFKNGKILLLYDSFAPGVITNSSTIGLQSSSPDIGLQVAFNTAYLHGDLAVFARVPGDFITNVEPAYGIIPENSTQVITITYDAEDNTPGPYTQELILESNDLEHPEVVVDNAMYVYSPGIFAGIVYDNDNDMPLNGVLITAGPFQTSSDENGEYVLYVDEGNYDVSFEKLGYNSVTIRDTLAVKEEITPIDIGMWDKNYPPSYVAAEMLDDNHTCLITWGLPQGPYEIIMDDGEADDFFVYAHAGSWNAVKFTPSGYPATVIGGSFYVGDGSFPGPFLGTVFGVAVFDDDGLNGLPETLIDSGSVTVNNSGWVDLDWLEAIIEEGSFYLAMYQAGNVPHAAPIGIDSDNPTHYRSYSRFQSGNWILSPLQDFMIRAYVDGPEGNLAILNQTGEMKSVPAVPDEGRDVADYRVTRFSNFDPDTVPGTGFMVELGSTDDLSFFDDDYLALMPGWYAYGVKAHYTSGLYSDFSYSNIIGYQMDCQVTFNITLTTGADPVNALITLQGLDYPYETFSGATSSDGLVVFEEVWKGNYKVEVDKIGFDVYDIELVNITGDQVFNIILSQKKYPPTCLSVDPVSMMATWCFPVISALEENFEGKEFPPKGWQSTAACDTTAWIRTRDGSSSGWTIPAWDSYYAAYLDVNAGSDCNGCCEYLITPPVDLRESQNFVLSFNSFYDGMYGQLAFIEYSYDQGQTWEVLFQAMPATDWRSLELDLVGFGGPEQPEQMWFAFHAEDAGEYASGWAIDNINIKVPEPPALYQDFSVFLDDFYLGQTGELHWDYAPLEYGKTYTASVAAHYSSGLSAKDYYTFESKYLFPPQNLEGAAPDDAAILTWDPPGTSIPNNLQGYNIYKNGVFLHYSPHPGGWVPQTHVDTELDPGMYHYSVTAVYDLTPYGFPGETGESMVEGPELVVVDYCTELEFTETWDVGSIGGNDWTSDGPNWSVIGQTGNPPPVAVFSWDPIQTDYEISLESYPLCALGITEGYIQLDFDLALASIQTTGQERLLVDLWTWDIQEWITVAQYSNALGTFNWTLQHINLGDMPMDKVFKIRFRAKGSFSPAIRGWFIDNIHVYRVCPAPQDILIDPDFYEGIRLTWEYPQKDKSGNGNGDRELEGYMVYRSVNSGPFELITTSPAGMPYIDPESNLAPGSMYCYKVSAVYTGAEDQCESLPSNEVCAIWTGTDHYESAGGSLFEYYPNPADKYLIINSAKEMKTITLVDLLGSIVIERHVTGKQFEFNTANVPAGAYIIRVQTDHEVSSGVITIRR